MLHTKELMTLPPVERARRVREAFEAALNKLHDRDLIIAIAVDSRWAMRSQKILCTSETFLVRSRRDLASPMIAFGIGDITSS
jgi:hypothetical protein